MSDIVYTEKAEIGPNDPLGPGFLADMLAAKAIEAMQADKIAGKLIDHVEVVVSFVIKEEPDEAPARPALDQSAVLASAKPVVSADPPYWTPFDVEDMDPAVEDLSWFPYEGQDF